jgi:hypothetical protein
VYGRRGDEGLSTGDGQFTGVGENEPKGKMWMVLCLHAEVSVWFLPINPIVSCALYPMPYVVYHW